MATPTIYMTTSSSPSLSSPKGVAVDTDLNRLLICDSGNNRVTWCHIDGIKQISTKSTYGATNENSFSNPSGAVYYNGCYYICDTGNHVIVRLRARDLAYKGIFGTVGTSGATNALLNSPQDIATDGAYLYVADTTNDRIMKIILETFSYYAKSTGTLNLSTPKGVLYKRENGEALFIADTGNNRIIKTQNDFTLIESSSTGLTDPYQMVHYRDMIHIVNQKSGDDNIVILSSDGLSAQTTHADSTVTLSSPTGIALYRNAYIVSDTGNNRITVWKAYDPRDSFDSSTVAKFGGVFFDNPLIVIGEDSLIVGATQESGSPNRWVEEDDNNYSIGWVEE